jgi:GTP-binding protein HflX
MFATLDPKLRAITLPSRRRILLADTVGFVRDLPHTLVTAFRATLEEVERAEVLLHVRDASSHNLEQQKEDVEKVLAELEVKDAPRIEVLNKADLLTPAEASVLVERGEGLLVSSLKQTGLDALLLKIEESLTKDPIEEAWFQLPQSEGRTLAALEGGSTVLASKYEGNVVRLHVAGPSSLFGRYRRYRLKNAPEAEHASAPA